jgi:hypothetical protein
LDCVCKTLREKAVDDEIERQALMVKDTQMLDEIE